MHGFCGACGNLAVDTIDEEADGIVSMIWTHPKTVSTTCVFLIGIRSASAYALPSTVMSYEQGQGHEVECPFPLIEYSLERYVKLTNQWQRHNSIHISSDLGLYYTGN